MQHFCTTIQIIQTERTLHLDTIQPLRTFISIIRWCRIWCQDYRITVLKKITALIREAPANLLHNLHLLGLHRPAYPCQLLMGQTFGTILVGIPQSVEPPSRSKLSHDLGGGEHHKGSDLKLFLSGPFSRKRFS